MNKNCLIILFLTALLFGCAKAPEGVNQFADENSNLKEQIRELESQVTDLKNQLTSVTEERDKYLKELDEFYLTKITGTVDLMHWDDNDMIRALGKYNDKFNGASWKIYVYRRDNKDFYWQLGGEFVQDPFFELRRKDQDQELNVSHLRIERLAIDYNQTLAQEEYAKYVQNVLKETQLDKDITCYQQTICRDIKVIKCTKDSKDYHSWFEGSHLFTSLFDSREALDAFEKFYCYSQPGSMTSIQ